MKPVSIMGVPVHPVTNDLMWEKLEDMLSVARIHTVMTPNPEMVMTALNNPQLLEALTLSDLVIPDGIGLIIASRLKKWGLKERVTGIDTMDKILQLCHRDQRSIFLLGGKPGRPEKAVQHILTQYPGIHEAWYHHGYFNENEEEEIIELIHQKQPDVLFVCLGSPRQEIWIHQYRNLLKCRLAMGTGGSVDVYAGEVKRAPKVFQKAGLEWLYRLIQEPSRWKRMMVLPVFLWRAIWWNQASRKRNR